MTTGDIVAVIISLILCIILSYCYFRYFATIISQIKRKIKKKGENKMGCDIHNHIEYKKNIYIGDNSEGKPVYEERWICGDYFKVNPYYNKWENDSEKPFELVRFCEDRNYGLFSLLADVRNYSNNKPISEPKGLPNDLSNEVIEDAEHWGLDGHSHSFFTLKELLDYQKEQPKLKRSGYISFEDAKALDEFGKHPECWCQLTTAQGWVYREWETRDNSLDNLINEIKKRANDLYVISDFLWEDDPEEAYKKSDKIRLVFWFDN